MFFQKHPSRYHHQTSTRRRHILVDTPEPLSEREWREGEDRVWYIFGKPNSKETYNGLTQPSKAGNGRSYSKIVRGIISSPSTAGFTEEIVARLKETGKHKAFDKDKHTGLWVIVNIGKCGKSG